MEDFAQTFELVYTEKDKNVGSDEDIAGGDAEEEQKSDNLKDNSESKGKKLGKEDKKTDKNKAGKDENGDGKTNNSKTNEKGTTKAKECFTVAEKYRYISQKNELKFVVDNMLNKLVRDMRNVGIDTEFVSEKDYEQLETISRNEERIIITRDTKFTLKKHGLPTFLLLENDPASKQNNK